MKGFILLVNNDLTLLKTKINTFCEGFLTGFDYVLYQD
nr:hypothetical protein [Mucilaginibacter sp. X5P1]